MTLTPELFGESPLWIKVVTFLGRPRERVWYTVSRRCHTFGYDRFKETLAEEDSAPTEISFCVESLRPGEDSEGDS